MKLFSTLFNLVALPVVVVKDVVTALPDVSTGRGAFRGTREHCEKIDEDLSK